MSSRYAAVRAEEIEALLAERGLNAAAKSVVITIPALIVFVVARRDFARGLACSGPKG